jgi:hypothetical protein
MLHNWSRYTRENGPRELSIPLCIFEARESFVSRPNKTGGDQEIASLIADVKRAIAQLAAAEGLFGRAWQLGKLLPAIKERVGHGKWIIWLSDDNSGRRARLRIAKSSISKRSFSFQKTIDLRQKNAIFNDQRRVHDR